MTVLQYQELEASIRNAQSEIETVIQVAAIYSVGLGDMGDFIERFRKRLLFDRMVHMAGIAGEDELIVISLRGEHLRHLLTGQHPVVHSIAHHIRVE